MIKAQDYKNCFSRASLLTPIIRINQSHCIAFISCVFPLRVSDIRQFVVNARPATAATEFVLMTTFPNRELTDESQTLKEANLLNAVIVQRLKWWCLLVAMFYHSTLSFLINGRHVDLRTFHYFIFFFFSLVTFPLWQFCDGVYHFDMTELGGGNSWEMLYWKKRRMELRSQQNFPVKHTRKTHPNWK